MAEADRTSLLQHLGMAARIITRGVDAGSQPA
jgi:hypothetical protein